MNRAMLMIVIALLLLPMATVYAGESTVTPADSVTPLFTHIAFLDAGLKIDSAGKSICFGNTALYNQNYSVELTVTLQQLTSSGWVSIKAWTDSGIRDARVEAQHYVVKGTYRVLTTVKAYDTGGALLESASAYSSSVTY